MEKAGSAFVVDGKIARYRPLSVIQLLRHLKIRTYPGARRGFDIGYVGRCQKKLARSRGFLYGASKRRSELLGIQSEIVVFGDSSRIIGIGITVRSRD